jgi:hypothetical protein
VRHAAGHAAAEVALHCARRYDGLPIALKLSVLWLLVVASVLGSALAEWRHPRMFRAHEGGSATFHLVDDPVTGTELLFGSDPRSLGQAECRGLRQEFGSPFAYRTEMSVGLHPTSDSDRSVSEAVLRHLQDQQRLTALTLSAVKLAPWLSRFDELATRGVLKIVDTNPMAVVVDECLPAGLPVLLLLVGAHVMYAKLARPRVRWWHLSRQQCCGCGYSLEGGEPIVCPECGHRFSAPEREVLVQAKVGMIGPNRADWYR